MTRKKPKPSSAQLEEQGSAILRRADDLIVAELARHREILERMQQELIQPRNDPEYLKTLEDSEARRNEIANHVATVHIVPDGGETWIGVSINNRRNQPEAREVARLMADHFEAKVISHEPSI